MTLLDPNCRIQAKVFATVNEAETAVAFLREPEFDFTLRKILKCGEIEAGSAGMVATGRQI
jgi:hypothetical protein